MVIGLRRVLGLANPSAAQRNGHSLSMLPKELVFQKAKISISLLRLSTCAFPPKSNVFSAFAIDAALYRIYVLEKSEDVPDHLRDLHYKGAKNFRSWF